jgi:hypothetical protein
MVGDDRQVGGDRIASDRICPDHRMPSDPAYDDTNTTRRDIIWMMSDRAGFYLHIIMNTFPSGKCTPYLHSVPFRTG